MGEEFDFKVKQVVDEIIRMGPDIEREEAEKFAKQSKDLEHRESATMGNVQHANSSRHAPKISSENVQNISNNFQNEKMALDTVRADSKKENTLSRSKILVNKYCEVDTEEEKTAVYNAVQTTFYPPVAENTSEPSTGQGDYFNPDDFHGPDSAKSYEGLSGEFNAAASYEPSGPSGDGIEH